MSILHIALALIAPLGARPDAPQFTPPPGEATAEERALLAGVTKLVIACPEIVPEIFAWPDYFSIHDRTEFRELLRDHVRSSKIRIVAADEPGERLIVFGQVRGKDGTPAKNALVYVYQTSAKGWYSDKATHISGNSGDFRHARLFGYLRTDDDGRYEITTIRPGGYPTSELPAHIHVHVETRAGDRLGTEIRFDDDPRMTAAQRESSRAARFLVVPTRRADGDTPRAQADLVLD